MPSVTTLHRSTCVVYLSALTIFTPVSLAQQDEIPPAPPTVSSPEDSDASPASLPAERIVDGRPNLYGLKRAVHPVSWVQAGVRPVLRLFERAGLGDAPGEEKAPRNSGVKITFQGLGSGSGFGPKVKPF